MTESSFSINTTHCGFSVFLFLIFCVLTATLQGCSSSNQTEEAIRDFMRDAELAVENSDIGDIRNLIAENYTDSAGRSKRDLIQYVSYQILRKRAIHLFISISAISFPDQQTAQVEFIAAMTGAPAESKNALRDLQADLYSFTCTLRLIDNSWKLGTAAWQPAMLEDLFPQ